MVDVSENPVIAQVAFEGNHQLVNKDLQAIVSLRANSVYTAEAAEQDRQAILDAYAHKGYYSTTVVPQIILLPENRVNLVFKIHDGKATYISRIAFVGNNHFSEATLRDVISSRESAWWRFLSTADSYDPARVGLDQDLLRRFYLRSGYPDLQAPQYRGRTGPRPLILLPDLRPGRGTALSHWQGHHRLATCRISTAIRSRAISSWRRGDWYNGDAITQSVQAITTDVEGRGYAFVQVKPIETQAGQCPRPACCRPDASKSTEGPRVFLERIDITGNSRTEDKVIRREFAIAEGDAFNAEKIKQSRQRLQELQYFKNVDMSTQPGSAPDKIVLTTNVQEEATGSFTIGGGYSTDDGALVDLGLNEKNLIGTGIDAGITGVLAQRASQIDLSVTDPYFLDRNLMLGGEVFDTTNNNLDISQYEEQPRRLHGPHRLCLQQLPVPDRNYSLVDRDVYDVETDASLYVKNEAGWSLLSQVGQTITLDHRDSTLDPHSGYIIRLAPTWRGSAAIPIMFASSWMPVTTFRSTTSPATTTGARAARPAAGYLYRYGGN